MKQRFPIVLAILSLLVALIGIAAAPIASRIMRLVSVQYVLHKGPVFTFEVSGKFPRSALKGTVYVQGGGSYPLYCTQVNDTTVKCSASQRISDVNVSLTWGGSTFWTYVPEAPKQPEPVEYCYDIYDWDVDNPLGTWKSYGTHCRNIPAQNGEILLWYNAAWDGTYDYEFMPQGPVCSGVSKNAYYYTECAEDGGGGT